MAGTLRPVQRRSGGGAPACHTCHSGHMSLSLLDWRRRVARPVRRGPRRPPTPPRRTRRWRAGRDDLLATHPDTPLRPRTAPGSPGCRSRPTTRHCRFEVEVDPEVEPQRLEVPTGTDGVVPFERVGGAAPARTSATWTSGGWRRTAAAIFVPVKDALAGQADLRRRALPARHRQGRRPRWRRRPGHRPGHAGRRPELRLQPVLRLRPGMGLPAGASRATRWPSRCRAASCTRCTTPPTERGRAARD